MIEILIGALILTGIVIGLLHIYGLVRALRESVTVTDPSFDLDRFRDGIEEIKAIVDEAQAEDATQMGALMAEHDELLERQMSALYAWHKGPMVAPKMGSRVEHYATLRLIVTMTFWSGFRAGQRADE